MSRERQTREDRRGVSPGRCYTDWHEVPFGTQDASKRGSTTSRGSTYHNRAKHTRNPPHPQTAKAEETPSPHPLKARAEETPSPPQKDRAQITPPQKSDHQRPTRNAKRMPKSGYLDSGVCKINARRKKREQHIIFAPFPPKFNVDNKAERRFYKIGRLFCNPLHSKMSVRQH
jgi:hypothetical protein